MVENGFYMGGTSLGHWNTHQIDASNTVNGKSIYYFANSTNFTVPSGAAQVILANCSGVVVKGQNCSNVPMGITIAYSDSISVHNNSCDSNSRYGIYLWQSSNGALEHNTVFSCVFEGIILRGSHDNTINENTVTFTDNYGITLLESDNNILNGNNWSNNGYGIDLRESDGNTFENNTAHGNNEFGVYASSSDYNVFMNNSFNSNNRTGVRLSSSDYCTFSHNTISQNSVSGIYGYLSDHNTFLENAISGNIFAGISMDTSHHCTVIDNILRNNGTDFRLRRSSYATLNNNSMGRSGMYIWGDSLSHWNTHSINSSNNVDGKPLYYFKDTSDITVPLGAGQIAIANCQRMTVEDQNITNATMGISVAYSSYISIMNTSCDFILGDGMYFYYIDNVTLTDITCSWNDRDGISLYHTDNVTLTDTTSSWNNRYGLHIEYSSNITMKNSRCNGNILNGVFLREVDHSTFNNNVFSRNNESGVWFVRSSNNGFTNTTCYSNNRSGIRLSSYSSENIIENSSFSSNKLNGVDLSFSSSYNNFHNNTISENTVGIMITQRCKNNSVQYNEIYNNTVFGINATDNYEHLINASHCWWGHESGPYHPAENQQGQGDSITDFVIFDPWSGKKENRKPVITTGDDQEAYEGSEYNVDYEAWDPDNDTLMWYLSTNASFLNIVNTTGRLFGSPQQEDIGSYWVNISVSDGRLTDHHNFTLQVFDVNYRPVIITEDVAWSQEYSEYIVQYQSSDRDNDSISWVLNSSAGFLTIDPVTGILSGTPSQQDVGSHYVNITAFDGELYDYHNFTLLVNNVNDIPQVAIIRPENSSLVNLTVIISGTASDVDSSIEKVEITINGGDWEMVTGTTSWMFEWDTTSLENGEYRVSIRAFDGENFSDVEEITLNVQNIHAVNIVPTISILSPENSTKVSEVVNITGTSNDEDGVVEKVEFRIDDGFWELAQGTEHWTFEWRTEEFENGEHIITVRNHDGENYSEEAHMILIVDNDEGKDGDGNDDDNGSDFPSILLIASGIAIVVIILGFSVILPRIRKTGSVDESNEDWDIEDSEDENGKDRSIESNFQSV